MKLGVQTHSAGYRRPLYIVAKGAGDSVVVDRRDWNRRNWRQKTNQKAI